jgi:hypothetical protein
MVIDSQGRLLFVGIPRKTIVSFQSVFSKLGLQLRNIELDTAAIAKSLLKRKKRSVLFVCVKKSKTHLSIVSTAGMVLWSITKPIGRTHLEQQGSQEKLLLAIVFMKEFAKAELETELEEIAFTGLGKHKKLRKEVEQGMSLRPLPLHLSKDLAGITMTPTEAIQYAPVLALAFSNGRIDSGLQLAALEKVELTGSLPRAEKAKQLGETKKQHVLSTSSAKNGKHAIGEHTSTYVGMAVAVFSLLLFYMGIVTGVTGQKMEADITHTGSSAYGEVRVEETEEEESFIQSSFSYGQAEAEDGQSSIDSSFKYSVQD